jgi:hypothetical protein
VRRFLKFLHTAGAMVTAGGLAAFMFVLANGPAPDALPEYAAMRHSLAMLSKWLITPGMVVTVASGLLAMGVHYPFHNLGWVWLKALSGLLIFEATLASVDSPAREAAEWSRKASTGEIDAVALAGLVEDKWAAWWALLVLFAANVVLGIWRPRLTRRRTSRQLE